MSYVAFHRETTVFLNHSSKTFATRGAAKGAITRAAKAGKINAADYATALTWFFDEHIEKMVTRVNLMSKEEYQERANTSVHCSPAYESYWSM
jgi:hypothetical protein